MVLDKDVNLINRQYENQVNDLTQNYNSQLEDLERKLASIEVRVGGDKLYLDAEKILIAQSELQRLDQYKSYDGGKYYVSLPTLGNWQEKNIRQIDVLQMMVGKDAVAQMKIKPSSPLEPVLQMQARIWHNNNIIEFEPQGPIARVTNKIKLHPYVLVLPLDVTTLRKVQHLLEKHHASAEKSPDIVGHEFASFMLADTIISSYMLSVFSRAKYQIVSVQKSKNIFYCQTITRFDKQQSDNGQNMPIFLDQKFIFIGKESSGLMVRISVPSYDLLRNDAYAWTKEWLVSLRIPIE